MPKRRLLAIGLLLTICGVLFAPLGQIAPADAAVHQLTAHGSRGVMDFSLTPDGQRVVYRLYDVTSNRVNLYSVAITGGQPAYLALAVPPNPRFVYAGRQMYAISPDSRHVLYYGMPASGPIPTATPPDSYNPVAGFGLYSVPIDGSRPSALISDDPEIYRFMFSADSQTAIFAIDTDLRDTYAAYEIYARSRFGGPIRKLSIALGPDERINDLDPSEDFHPWAVFQSGHLVYRVWTPQGEALFSVPVEGIQSQNVRINPCGSNAGFFTTADGQRLVLSDSDCVGGRGVFSMNAVGGDRVRLSPPSAGNAGPVLITQDQRFVAFASNCQTIILPNTPNQYTCDLYMTPLAGPASEAKLIVNGTLDGANPILRYRASPNGDWLVLISPGPPFFPNPFRLYLVSRTAEPNTARLLASLNSDSQFMTANFSSDNRYFVFQGNDADLYSVDLANPAAGPNALDMPFRASLMYVNSIPQSERIMLDFNYVYTVPAAGPSSEILQISHTWIGQSTRSIVTPNGRKIVYIGHYSGQLYVSDVDQAATSPTPIFASLPGCGNEKGPTATVFPTRTPYPTEWPLYLPGLQQCFPGP